MGSINTNNMVYKQHNRIERVILWFSTAVILLAAFFSFYYFYLLFFPSKVTKVSKIEITPNVVHPGELIHINASYCKTTPAISTIIRTVESTKNNNVIVPYAVIASNAPLGCGVLEEDTILPTNLTPGQYRIDFTIQYQANPVREIVEEFYSKEFMVIK